MQKNRQKKKQKKHNLGLSYIHAITKRNQNPRPSFISQKGCHSRPNSTGSVRLSVLLLLALTEIILLFRYPSQEWNSKFRISGCHRCSFLPVDKCQNNLIRLAMRGLVVRHIVHAVGTLRVPLTVQPLDLYQFAAEMFQNYSKSQNYLAAAASLKLKNSANCGIYSELGRVLNARNIHQM